MNLSEGFDGFLPYQNSVWTDPRQWAACGFFSLHHAMAFLGQAGTYSVMRDKHNSFWDMIFEGTLAQPLIKLAKKEGLHAEHYETQFIKSYPRHLDQELRSGSPIIIGSGPANHWICLGGFLDNHLEGIVEATASLTGHDEGALKSLAHGYRDAAEFHNLVVAKGHDAQASSAFPHKLAAKADANT